MTTAKSAVRASSIYAIGNISRQLVAFIMLPVYTRYLTPSDYGIVGLLVFALSILEPLFGARLAQAIPKFFHETEGEHRKLAVVSSALTLTASISAVTMLVVMTFSEFSAELIFGSANNQLALIIFATLILTQAVEYYALVFIRIQGRPWLFLTLNLSKLVIQLSLNIVFVVFLEMGALGVVIGTAISTALFSFCLGIYTYRTCGLGFDLAVVRRMISFSWPLWISGLAVLYIGFSSRYLIRIFASLNDVGLYELAARFASIIPALIWSPFDQFWQTERFLIHRSHANADEIFRKVFVCVCTVLFIMATGMSLLGPFIVELMASPQYHSASQALPFLSMAAIYGCLTTYANFSHLIESKTGWIARNNYAIAALLTALLLVLVPRFGFLGASIALMLAQFVQFLTATVTGRRHYDMHLSLTLVIGMTLCSGAALAASHLIASMPFWTALAGNCLILAIFVAAIAGFFYWSPNYRPILVSVAELLPERLTRRRKFSP